MRNLYMTRLVIIVLYSPQNKLGSFRGEDLLDIDLSETRIACGGHVC
jgi:hypothetical protein